MLVEPGFFRTELLLPQSTKYAQSSIDDYAERTAQTVAAWNSMNGQQGGDPAKPPTHWYGSGGRRSRRSASRLAPTLWRLSRRRPTTCWLKPTPTATCPPPSPTRTPEAMRSGALHRAVLGRASLPGAVTVGRHGAPRRVGLHSRLGGRSFEGARAVTGNDESALANTQVHYLSSRHVGDEFRIIVGGCEGAPAGVGVLVVLDAFFNFGTALETVRLLAMAEHVKPLLVVGVGYRPVTVADTTRLRGRDFSPVADPRGGGQSGDDAGRQPVRGFPRGRVEAMDP